MVLSTRTCHVYSDPRQAEQGGDGLTDLQEFQKRTDPTRPDNNDDGLVDWVSHTNLVANPGGLIECLEDMETNGPACFYRVLWP